MTIKETINNVLHANENAEKAKREAKRARRNAMIGAECTISSIVISITAHCAWSRKIKARQKMTEDELMMKLRKLQEKVDTIEKESNVSFTEVIPEEGGDKNVN